MDRDQLQDLRRELLDAENHAVKLKAEGCDHCDGAGFVEVGKRGAHDPDTEWIPCVCVEGEL